jgi:hypothetical protein
VGDRVTVDVLMAEFVAGRVPIAEVAADFRSRTWSEPRPPAGSADELFARTLEDPRLFDPDSSDRVEASFIQRQISLNTYTRLFNAVAGGRQAPEVPPPLLPRVAG